MAAYQRSRILLYAAIGVFVTNRKKKLLKKKQIKRFWRRSIFRDRKLHSEYYTLFQVLKDTDREWFFKYIRMSPERFSHLLSLVRDKISKKDTKLRECISAEERLVITLRYLSQGMFQFTLAFSFRVGRQTVCSIVQEVCEAIHEVLSPIYARTPNTTEEWAHIANDFENLWDFLHVIGAIDGKHIRMDCPKKSGSKYHNYKGYFSFILLAVCDARYTFTFYDVGQYGSANDTGTLNVSEFGKMFQQYFFNYPAPEKIS